MDRFGPTFGEELIVLWAISRFSGGDRTGEHILDELVGPDLKPRFRVELAADIAAMSFALGLGLEAAR